MWFDEHIGWLGHTACLPGQFSICMGSINVVQVHARLALISDVNSSALIAVYVQRTGTVNRHYFQA